MTEMIHFEVPSDQTRFLEVIEKPLYPYEVNEMLRLAGYPHIRISYVGTTTSLISFVDASKATNYQAGLSFEDAELRVSLLLKKKIKLVRFY